ncbi:hypothetical protein EJ04DRAFT_523897 [Polyplosphaeria fusca]|uniref:Uncharacterized protein n=1 Tax=Polyplosphaeria fusca TaxID=682080 RepID=A0A9P4QZA3_9PLEO|nr:hypothetical protein EJ04DRAFT_523897 [Polyplosphaeria fusca]
MSSSKKSNLSMSTISGSTGSSSPLPTPKSLVEPTQCAPKKKILRSTKSSNQKSSALGKDSDYEDSHPRDDWVFVSNVSETDNSEPLTAVENGESKETTDRKKRKEFAGDQKARKREQLEINQHMAKAEKAREERRQQRMLDLAKIVLSMHSQSRGESLSLRLSSIPVKASVIPWARNLYLAWSSDPLPLPTNTLSFCPAQLASSSAVFPHLGFLDSVNFTSKRIASSRSTKLDIQTAFIELDTAFQSLHIKQSTGDISEVQRHKSLGFSASSTTSTQTSEHTIMKTRQIVSNTHSTDKTQVQKHAPSDVGPRRVSKHQEESLPKDNVPNQASSHDIGWITAELIAAMRRNIEKSLHGSDRAEEVVDRILNERVRSTLILNIGDATLSDSMREHLEGVGVKLESNKINEQGDDSEQDVYADAAEQNHRQTIGEDRFPYDEHEDCETIDEAQLDYEDSYERTELADGEDWEKWEMPDEVSEMNGTMDAQEAAIKKRNRKSWFGFW